MILAKFSPWKKQEELLRRVTAEGRISLQNYDDLSKDMQQLADKNHFSKNLRYEKKI
ncbi:hypothetical protein D3C80_1840350 [compost metagenome]|jgi:hypothetical protein